MLIKVENNEIVDRAYSIKKLKQENPNTSFSSTVSESTLNSYGVYTVAPAPTPSHDPKTQKVLLGISNIDGTWTQVWTVASLSDDTCALNLRAKRDKLLADCDWTQMNDSPLSNEDKTAWATYRQELRDITSLEAWPHLTDDDWPVAP